MQSRAKWTLKNEKGVGEKKNKKQKKQLSKIFQFVPWISFNYSVYKSFLKCL